MNKAFTKEDDGSTPERLPDLPVSRHPNHVTATGLAMLQARRAGLVAAIDDLRARQDDLPSLHPLAVAERDLRYVEARLATAMLVDPAKGPADKVTFGATVTVAHEDGTRASYRIVGEDEADPRSGLIPAPSPLARALLEAQIGDIVDWSKPSGTEEIEVLEIAHL